MRLYKNKSQVVEDGWNDEQPTTYFSQPYGFVDSMEWIYNVMIRPSKACYNPSEYVHNNSEVNQITPRLRLAFIGDIMVLGETHLEFGDDVKNFFLDVDFLVANFEGTIVTRGSKPVFMAQAHADNILRILGDFFPPKKTILSCANNHSGDYGWSSYRASYQRLQDHGFLTIGRRDEPSIVIDGNVNIAACTSWSNQKCRFVAMTDEADRYFFDDAKFNILYPHWGYEMQLHPKPCQVRQGRELLTKWNMIVGHHSHCPQPIAAYQISQQQRLLAYSLGNFCEAISKPHSHIGLILKVELGPDHRGVWAAGKIQWEIIAIQPASERCVELRLKEPLNK